MSGIKSETWAEVNARRLKHMSGTSSSFIEHLKNAQAEAYKRQISANAIFINKELYYSKVYSPNFGHFDLICGLKILYSDDLPDDTFFALVNDAHLPTEKDKRIVELETEISFLRMKIQELNELI